MPSILDLSVAGWRLGRVPRRPFHPAPVDDMERVVEWLPAQVPGDVRADLVAAGRLDALDTPAGIAAAQWADDFDWWYCAHLPQPEAEDDRLLLEADGIDYYSAIWLDENLLSTHAGMFSRQVVLLPCAPSSRPQQLRIRIWGGGAMPRTPAGSILSAAAGVVSRLSPGTEYFPDRMQAPKAQFSYGWDFSPRLLTAGIWDEIRLVACRDAYLRDVRVIAEPLGEGDPTPVRWRVRLGLWRFGQGEVDGVVVVSDLAGNAVASHTERNLQGGAPEIAFEAPAMRRWWPWDQGEPYRYRVTVTLYSAGDPADERSVVTGIRTVERTALADGKPWRFTVNGRHLFLRGANWTPANILPGRVTRGDYAALLAMARGAGVNFLRVWGGGIREKQAFWNECDRLGILAWQEFPLACAFLDHYPRNRGYLTALEQEARGMVRLLRNHPSLLAWCGGNEIHPRREAAPLAVIAAVLAMEDGDRPFIPASPLIVEGDVHDWDVWHGAASWAGWTDKTPAFMSEFGLQSLPVTRTLAEMWNGDPPGMRDPGWPERKAQVGKLRRYGGPAIDGPIEIAALISQRVQAAALQTAIEAARIRREPAMAAEAGASPSCGGVAFWQFSDPWPAVTWSVIDHARRPKLAYAMLQRSYAPLLVAAIFPRRPYEPGDDLPVVVWLVNDRPDEPPAGVLEAWLDGGLVWQAEAVQAPSGAARRAGGFTVRLAQSPQELSLVLRGPSGDLASNTYDLGVPLPGRQGFLHRVRRFVADWLVTG